LTHAPEHTGAAGDPGAGFESRLAHMNLET